MRHKETMDIVNQAIQCLGTGRKGLAERLDKDPSLVSRYASGIVRPKAETLIECQRIIENSTQPQLVHQEVTDELINQIGGAINNLSASSDSDLIHTLHGLLKLAKKL